MTEATKDVLAEFDELAEKRKREILNTKDSLKITGTAYYVSNSGSDENDGKSPEKPWKTVERVSKEKLSQGDGVCFKRGDIFRGHIVCSEGVTYCAYGEGEKPRIYGWNKNLADPTLWTLYNSE